MRCAALRRKRPRGKQFRRQYKTDLDRQTATPTEPSNNYINSMNCDASIPTPQPVHWRPMFGAFGGGGLAVSSVTFVSQAAIDAGVPEALGLKKRTIPARYCSIGKASMVLNSGTPKIEVDAQTYEVAG